MQIFRITAILTLVFILASYLQRFRRPALDKIFISLLLLTGILFIIYPELTTRLAHFLGIGRGADLIFYLAILGFGYLSVILYAKIKRLEDQLIALIRKQALDSFSQHIEKHD